MSKALETQCIECAETSEFPKIKLDNFTFYYGCASGSSKKALREMEETQVMLNYATENNKPWNNIDRLFIDSGGYSFIKGMGEYRTTNAEYLRYVNRYNPELFALRDYPCEPDVLEEHNRTVRQHQDMTTQRHRELLDLWEKSWWTQSQPVSVLQGWELEDYLRHLDEMREQGVLTEYVGIGSVCRRNQDQDLREIILTIREELPSNKKLHAFGVKRNILRYPEALKALDSADSMAYEDREKYSARISGSKRKSFRDSALEYLLFKRQLNNTMKSSIDAMQRGE